MARSFKATSARVLLRTYGRGLPRSIYFVRLYFGVVASLRWEIAVVDEPRETRSHVGSVRTDGRRFAVHARSGWHDTALICKPRGRGRRKTIDFSRNQYNIQARPPSAAATPPDFSLAWWGVTGVFDT